MITTPYNFVPLSEKVVMPFWAKHVSHDIPFKEEESGILDITIKAESPIYVRNGVSRDVTDSDKNAFNNIDNKYFIPGSSIKGMIRSVMEIMSFGRIGNKVNDHRYSVRDFQNDDIYPKSLLAREVLCGWLFKKDGEYFLDDCGKPGRISHKTLDSFCKQEKKISTYYKNIKNITKDSKSAKAKYDAFPFDKRSHKFTLDFDIDRPIYKIDDNGNPGIIVFSGQPGVRVEEEGKKGKGKHLEFIFFNPTQTFPVQEEAIKNFFFAYYDHDRNQQKEDWKWRKGQLDKGEKIPVFFRKNSNSNDSIKDIGLSLLYKITYDFSIKNIIDLQQKNASAYDLAETIFGYTEKNDSLKGRVHVGHAFANGDIKPLETKTAVLAGPKASYYPNYIEQKANAEGKVESYKTFKNETSKINGWKRYPVRSSNEPISNNGTDNVSARFSPLPSQTEFHLQINYHNLRREELGALISAITFHNTEGLYHSIGSGKPLGYGKTSFIINNLDEEKKIELLKSFELYMDYSLENSTPLWSQSLQIKELFAMAKTSSDDGKLKYMELNDFVIAKGKQRTDPKFSLRKYTFISQNRVEVNGLGTESELVLAKVKYDKERAFFEEKQDIESLKKGIIDKSAIDLQSALKEKKSELIISLKLKRESIALEEQKAKLAEEIKIRLDKAAGGLPPEWSNIKDFGNLANRIPKWQNKLPNQIISEDFKEDLSVLLEKIIRYELTIKKTKVTWEGSFSENKNYRKIIDWIGETKTKGLYKRINGNLN